MENAAKALEIAAGVLLAVIILSLIAYFFSTISEWPTQEDSMESAEQLAKFNLEYEVYEKSAMYGVDVISCLNKAKSNNEKYVEGSSFLSGNRYGDEFTINVFVNIKEPLEETIEVYYFDQETNTEKQRFDDSASEFMALTGDKDFQNNLPKEMTDMMDANHYTNFRGDEKLVTKSNKLDTDSTKYMMPNGGTFELTLADGTQAKAEDGTTKKYYALLDGSNSTSALHKLLEFSSNNPRMQARNSNTNVGSTSSFRYWSTVVWSTALYDFKTKRFTCDSIKYNEATGRVSEIYFSEIN